MNLSPTFAKNIPLEFFFGKMENFLTCRAAAAVLRENVLTEAVGNFFEEAALNAVYKTLFTQVLIPDLRLFFSELPNILVLNYSVVEQLRVAAVGLAQQMTVFQADWKSITDWDYLIKMFQTFDSYKHK